MVALFENGEHGDRASWIVRDVLKAYFDKKARAAKGRTQIARQVPALLPSPVPALLQWGGVTQ